MVEEQNEKKERRGGRRAENNRNGETVFPDNGNKGELQKTRKSKGKGRIKLGRKKLRRRN